MSLAGWSIREVPARLAQSIVVQKHYLHRKAPCSVAFGLIAPNGEVAGVVIYGTPSSAPLRSGIAGPEFSGDVVELTRLWIDDSAPRNGESYLIGNTVQKAGKRIVVSFADTEQGHIGAIYQATNWLYTGLSAKRTSWAIAAGDASALFDLPHLAKHGQTIADKMSADEARAIFGDRFSLQERSRKHRYIFIAGGRKDRKLILNSLRYPILPYPKKATDNEVAKA